jgi:large subunit ribosomal protein L33
VVGASSAVEVGNASGVRTVISRGFANAAERLVRGAALAKRNDLRPVVTLRSTAGTGYSYVTRKNRRTHPDRLVLRKFDPVAREHVDFREAR